MMTFLLGLFEKSPTILKRAIFWTPYSAWDTLLEIKLTRYTMLLLEKCQPTSCSLQLVNNVNWVTLSRRWHWGICQLTVRSMWKSQKATQYDESVLDNKMNVNETKEPIFFSILGFFFLKTFPLYTDLKSKRILRGIGLHYLITDWISGRPF